MSLPTIREHVAPNSTIGRDLWREYFAVSTPVA
jgi:hypothetical protein